MVRVLIADDHEIVRHGIREFVNRHAGWEVCGEAANGPQALDLAVRQRPDVAIVEIALSGLNGVSLTRRLHRRCPQVRVLLFTAYDDSETVSAGLAAGARGYVLKSDSQSDLEAAIAALVADRPYFSSRVSEVLLESALNERVPSKLESFTLREMEVAQLVTEGNGNKRVAQLLGISVKTVESHRGAVMRKANVKTAAGLMRFALRHHLSRA